MAKWNSVLGAVMVCGVLSVAAGLSGCGSDSDGSSTEAANIAGRWNGPVTFGGVSHYELQIVQSGNMLTGTFSNDYGAQGTIGGTIDGDHVVMTLAYTEGFGGATAGFTELWDGYVNAGIDSLLGTATPNNGAMPADFALQH